MRISNPKIRMASGFRNLRKRDAPSQLRKSVISVSLPSPLCLIRAGAQATSPYPGRAADGLYSLE